VAEDLLVDIVWDGITRAETLHEEAAQIRQTLADAAKSFNWPGVFDLLSEHEDLVNTTRPGGSSLYAPLHQAAHSGAPVEVAQRLIKMLARRTLQNARGERPVDIAERRGHRHLLGVLAPEHKHHVPAGVLLTIQSHFHAVIRGRIDPATSGPRAEAAGVRAAAGAGSPAHVVPRAGHVRRVQLPPGVLWRRGGSFRPASIESVASTACLPSAWLRPGKTPNLNPYCTGFMNW
jgi:hypothetical protein